MRNVQIVTDSCSDLGADIRAKYGIEYVKMNIVLRGEEKPASLDWELYSPKELYDVMRAGERVTTTQVPAAAFTEAFTRILAAGSDIVYIACSGALSGSVRTGEAVAAGLRAQFPEAQIFCIDPKNSCLGEGMLAVQAAELRDRGLDAAAIAAEINRTCLTVNQFVTVDSLDTLRRAGRVKGSAAFFGNLFGVKPIIISDVNGQNVPIKKVKGRTAALDEIVNLLAAAMEGSADRRVFIGHADCAEDAAYLKDKVREVIGTEDIYVNFIGPIIGASIGPGAVAVYGVGRAVELAG